MNIKKIFALTCILFSILVSFHPCRGQTSDEESQNQEKKELQHTVKIEVFDGAIDKNFKPNKNYGNSSTKIQTENNIKKENTKGEVLLNQHEGQGVSTFTESDIEAVQKAAESGDAKAEVSLGQFYLEGKKVRQDFEVAKKWLQKAAMHGDSSAQFNLGKIYMTDVAGPIDYAEAANWFKLAAYSGNFEAQYSLGKMYLGGQGVDQNFLNAVDWFRKAASQGDVYAQYSYALMLENGIGIERNIEKAFMWYTTADTLIKAEDTIENIDLITKKMTKKQVEWARTDAQKISSKMKNIRDVISSTELLFTANSIIDNIIEGLRFGQVAITYPYEMTENDIGVAKIYLAFSKIKADIKCTLNENEKIEYYNIKICNEMEARLSGIAFQFDKLPEERQAVVSNDETYWHWDFFPIRHGKQKLYFDISVVFSVYGKEMIRNIKSLYKTVTIHPPPWFKSLWRLLKENPLISGIFATMIAAAIIDFFRRRIKRYSQKT